MKRTFCIWMMLWMSLSLYPFKQEANLQSFALFEEARQDRKAFWEKQAHCLHWFRHWNKVLEGNPPYVKWFVGGKLNACYNCLDRHMKTATRNKIALIWEGEKGEERRLTYDDLYKEVNKFSNVLKSLGVQKGDKVAIYLPMIPEAAVAMLSCARIGAVHTVVFGGFSAEALRDRILDAEAKLVITADGGFRRGKVIPLKESVDLALKGCPSIQNVIVVKHTQQTIRLEKGRDYWYDQLMENASPFCQAAEMDAEDELFILYTSGTTGKSKGIVHTTGGYMVGTTMVVRWVLDIKPSDILWCTADIGWIGGHSYVVYGPLSNGMTQLMYEGAPDWPQKDRFWKLIEKHRVSLLFTAPTAIRTFMKWGEEWIKKCNLSSLRLLGCGGEHISPQAWTWFDTHIGQKRCPVIFGWGQTETGGIMIAPIPGFTALKPGSVACPLPGVDVAILNAQGENSSSGLLAITSPWPSMLRGIHKDPKCYEEMYWKKWNSRYYFTGDVAKQDADGYFWLMGRVDDVMNVSGHRIGTVELESAFLDHPSIAEAAVIDISHPIKGQAIAAFVTLKKRSHSSDDLSDELKQHIVNKIGAFARPEKIIFIDDLPKTHNGKIMHRLLQDIAEGGMLSNLTTLSNPSVINDIKNKYQENEHHAKFSSPH